MGSLTVKGLSPAMNSEFVKSGRIRFVKSGKILTGITKAIFEENLCTVSAGDAEATCKIKSVFAVDDEKSPSGKTVEIILE